jgi:hypothetical protein
MVLEKTSDDDKPRGSQLVRQADEHLFHGSVRG